MIKRTGREMTEITSRAGEPARPSDKYNNKFVGRNLRSLNKFLCFCDVVYALREDKLEKYIREWCLGTDENCVWKFVNLHAGIFRGKYCVKLRVKLSEKCGTKCFRSKRHF